MRKGFLIVVVLAMGLGAIGPLAGANRRSGKGLNNTKIPFRPGEIVVKLKSGSKGLSSFSVRGFSSVLAARTHLLQTDLGRIYPVTASPLKTDRGFVSVKADGVTSTMDLLAEARRNPNVEYAEPNYIYRVFDSVDDAVDPLAAVIPNDPEFGKAWGLLNVGQKDKAGQVGTAGVDIGATKAWAYGTGSKKIVVAVIDTGLDYEHEELKDNVFVNTAEVAGNGVDDDGNGFVDDIHGWNFVAKTNDPMDDHSHGTHCAGTIGAKGNNGVGVAGVNWNVSIMPLKFLDADGLGSLADALEAIKYATKMKVKIVSNSWGGGGYSQALYDAIADARDHGILFVAAAGNESNNNDLEATYPASYALENVISVAAIDNKSQKASWSNFGKQTVHLAAPGVGILSTVPRDKGRYDYMSGTSMACPHVAGAAALVWAADENQTFSQVKKRLLSSVDRGPALRTKVLSSGRLNVYNAMAGIKAEPLPMPPPEAWKAIEQHVETKHPYDDGLAETFEIKHPGAKYMRVHFVHVGTEKGFDFIRVKSGGEAPEIVDELSGAFTDYTSEYVSGDQLTVELKADASINDFGFVIDRYEVIE